MSDLEHAGGPLHGVRVLDLTSVVMGPFATATLGDLGADVITIESGRGDTNRSMGPGPVRQLSDISLNLLRNKRNVAIDLKRPEGLEVALKLASTCDVFVTNLRPGPLARLGLAYEQVVAVRPDVVFCQAQGFASDTGRADDPAYDDVIQAAAGVPDVVGMVTGTPAMAPMLLADKVCGLVLAYAIMAGLYHRAVTGEGQRIEAPMVDALRAFMLVEHGSGVVSRPARDEVGYRRILTPYRRPARTADGLIAIFPYLPEHWEVLLRAEGADDLLSDPRLSRLGRQADPSFSYQALESILPRRTTAQWLDFCRANDIPAAEAPSLRDMADELPDAEHPVAGVYKMVPPPVRFSATPATVRRQAPLIGEHNREVLRDVGLTDDQIARLEESGVLRTRGSVDALRTRAAEP